MRMKIMIIMLSVLALASVFAVYAYRENGNGGEGRWKVSFAGKEYALEIADTDKTRSLGLGERDELCQSCAMLFVFDRPGRYAFWMKGMRFPLDIVWLSGDEAVHIERDIPADSQTIFAPGADADQVLEFNAGEAGALSIGDQVRISR